MTADDPREALTSEDRAWLREHGWNEPPPRPRQVEDRLVVDCRECGAELEVEHVEVTTYSMTVVLRYMAENPSDVLARHRPDCPS